MALSRVQLSVLGLGAAVLLATQNIDTRAEAQAAASNARRTTAGNPITGEGLPNPAPIVTRNWGQLPAGRTWGTTAGIDIDPADGNVWAYERCGAGTAGGGPGRLRQHAARSRSSSSIARPAPCSRTSARA